jgi:hypothetical protein
MTDTQWHAGPELLGPYARGELDLAVQAAVETHVIRCAQCRSVAAELVEAAELAPLWDRIKRDVVAPTQPRLVRVLLRLGVRETDLVILRASANVLVPLVLAAAAAVCFAILSSFMKAGYQEFFYQVIAPLLPAVFVTGAYDTTDPVRDVAEATPFSKLRIALLRTAVAVTGALPLVLLMSLVPDIESTAAAWLLPSLTLAVAALTLLTWLTATSTISVVTGVWLTVVGVLQAGDSLQTTYGPRAQATYAVVLVCLVALFGRRVVPARGGKGRR